MTNYQHERGWLDSDVWGDCPYDERSAWSWMIGEAAWKDTTMNANGRPVYLKRGQFTSSLRFMAGKWHWDKNRVDRYLKKLKLWSMIEIETDIGTGQSVITINNYNKYQGKRGSYPQEQGQQTGHPRDRGGTPTGQTRSPSIPSSQFENADDTRPQTIFERGEHIAEIVGWKDDPRWMGNYSRLQTWLDQDYDFLKDVMPAIRKVMASRQGQGPPGSLNYFDRAVADTKATRLKPMPEGKPNAPKPATGQKSSDGLAAALEGVGSVFEGRPAG